MSTSGFVCSSVNCADSPLALPSRQRLRTPAESSRFDGRKPVKKFENRQKGVNRIWQAIQKLAPAAPDAAQGAPEAAEPTKDATTDPEAAPAAKGAKKAKAKAKPKAKAAKAEATKPREGSKKAAILHLLRRAKGATLDEIMKATEWQAHSVRGFIAGTLSKKMGLKIESAKRESDGARVYRIVE